MHIEAATGTDLNRTIHQILDQERFDATVSAVLAYVFQFVEEPVEIRSRIIEINARRKIDVIPDSDSLPVDRINICCKPNPTKADVPVVMSYARIVNRTGSNISYSVNGRKQNRLSAGKQRQHTISSNSSGPSSVRISFDNGRGRTVSGNASDGTYEFKYTSTGLNLFRRNR